ncbi:MAG: hypothetical protein M1820_004993 [Bogoriella megaspora]|nr:MAG: hypothetical protein M1820_004993 [Bogoriella megaspora]
MPSVDLRDLAYFGDFLAAYARPLLHRFIKVDNGRTGDWRTAFEIIDQCKPLDEASRPKKARVEVTKGAILSGAWMIAKKAGIADENTDTSHPQVPSIRLGEFLNDQEEIDKQAIRHIVSESGWMLKGPDKIEAASLGYDTIWMLRQYARRNKLVQNGSSQLADTENKSLHWDKDGNFMPEILEKPGNASAENDLDQELNPTETTPEKRKVVAELAAKLEVIDPELAKKGLIPKRRYWRGDCNKQKAITVMF